MKIAFVTGSFPKLSETFVLDQITGLLDLGHDVEIFAFESTNEPVRHAAIERYALFERTTLLDRTPRGVLRGALASLPDIARWLPEARHRDALRTRFAHGRRGTFDVIYCHFGHVAERARRLRRVGFFDGPLVAVFHAYDLTVWPRLRGPGCYAELFAEAARLLPITEHWRRRLLELGADDEKLEVRRMGVDLEACDFRERTAGPSESLEFVSVGRLVEKKGFAVALEALAEVRPRMPRRFSYHVVGDGPLRPELEALAQQRGLSDIVTFHGDQSRDELATLLESKHVLVAPSVTAANGDTEGLPMVLIEGMARGLPVVTTAHSGIPELVRDGETGFVVPEADVEALGNALLEAASTERWPALSRAARSAIEERHDGRRLVRELVRLFESLPGALTPPGRAGARR
jgi:colanic acid/amylovoran biosynthesis glycosyltransferase